MDGSGRLGKWYFGLILYLTTLVAGPAQAQMLDDCVAREAVPDGVLSVAVRPAPPYIFEHGVRGLEGISVDLWERVARDLKLEYRYICLNLDETLAALQQGQIDVAISPLTISSSREQAFDFSHQYFSSSLVLASRPEAVSFNFGQVFNTMVGVLTSWGFLSVMLVFLGVTLVLALIADRHSDHYTPIDKEDMAGRFAFRVHILLMSGLNTLGMRKDIFSFRHVRVQMFFLVVLVFGTLFSSSLGGMITASFMKSSQQHFRFTADTLWQHRVSTMKGSTAEKYLNEKVLAAGMLNIEWLRRDTWAEVMDDLVSKRADVAIGDWVQMTYLANQPQYAGRVQIDSSTLRLEPHGWGLPAGSPLRDPVGQHMIGVIRHASWPETVRTYLGGDQVSAH